MMTSAEVRENAAIAEMPPLSKDVADAIQEIYQGQIFYDAKAKGNADIDANSNLGRNS